MKKDACNGFFRLGANVVLKDCFSKIQYFVWYISWFTFFKFILRLLPSSKLQNTNPNRISLNAQHFLYTQTFSDKSTISKSKWTKYCGTPCNHTVNFFLLLEHIPRTGEANTCNIDIKICIKIKTESKAFKCIFKQLYLYKSCLAF